MGYVFVFFLVLNGICYKGECGKNKKEVELLVVFVVIFFFLGNYFYIFLNIKRLMGYFIYFCMF